jgi:hypothetical protein
LIRIVLNEVAKIVKQLRIGGISGAEEIKDEIIIECGEGLWEWAEANRF